jgi:hypothetical protein
MKIACGAGWQPADHCQSVHPAHPGPVRRRSAEVFESVDVSLRVPGNKGPNVDTLENIRRARAGPTRLKKTAPGGRGSVGFCFSAILWLSVQQSGTSKTRMSMRHASGARHLTLRISALAAARILFFNAQPSRLPLNYADCLTGQNQKARGHPRFLELGSRRSRCGGFR